MQRRHRNWCALVFVLGVACAAAPGCQGSEPSTAQDSGQLDTGPSTPEVGDTSAAGDAASDTASDGGDSGPVSARVTRQFDPYTLDPGEEAIPCVQWTLDNEEPLYVNEVTLANNGAFHHSNWYVVPEDYAAGPDGYFDCEERGYRGFTAAVQGTVLFAQSTQARSEVQSFPDGVVTKIPPNHKIVADLHFLNLTPREFETDARLTLGLTHPEDVETVATPFVLSYNALDIPPNSEARFTGECDFSETYEGFTGEAFEMKLYYLLPHYHGLGNYFSLEILGGPRDGEKLFELRGFDAEANGHEFDPPAELTDADGFRFTCGFDNPRDESVGWGIGGQEMCMALGFGDAELVMSGGVEDKNEVVDRNDGIVYNEGPCSIQAVPRSAGQSMPKEDEKNGEMYVPESDAPEEVEPIPDCEERSGTAEPLRDPTLTNLETNLFEVGCAFSSCHDSEGPAAGLDLTADDLHGELMNHEMVTPTDIPLVDPGNPDGSWLYRVTSRCEPQSNAGPVSHMPRNSPTLLQPEVLAMVREWIARGARDD